MNRIPNEIRSEISSITNFLTEKGLAVHSRITQTRTYNGIVEVGWSKDGPNISLALKNIPYQKIYNHLLKEQQYNFVLLDGALMQLLYKFSNNVIVEHRLGFFPSPNEDQASESSPSDIEDSTEIEVSDFDSEGDIDTFLISPDDYINFEEIKFHPPEEKPPVRIDYTPGQYEPFTHSETHLHLGHTKNCRIPTSAPVGPSAFTLFILRSFYSNHLDSVTINKLTTVPRFNISLKPEEEGCVHLKVPSI